MPSLSRFEPYDLILVDAMNMMARMDWMDLSHNGRPTGMLYGTMKWVYQSRKEMPSAKIIFLWEGDNSWRKEKYPHYKGNRRRNRDAGETARFFDRVEEVKQALRYAGVWQVSHTRSEADDLAGYFVDTRPEQHILMVSKDRDWWQFVRERVDVQYGNRVLTLEDVQKELKFDPWKLPLYKSLRGDPSDNIPAIPRFPTKLAEFAVAKADSYDSLLEVIRSKESAWAAKLEAHKWQFDQNYELVCYNDDLIREIELDIVEPEPDLLKLSNILIRQGMDSMSALMEELFDEGNVVRDGIDGGDGPDRDAQAHG